MSSDNRPKPHGTVRGIPAVSRRSLLGAVTAASVATLPGVASPWDAVIAALPFAADAELLLEQIPARRPAVSLPQLAPRGRADAIGRPRSV